MIDKKRTKAGKLLLSTQRMDSFGALTDLAPRAGACHSTILLVPFFTAVVRFLADWFWISNILDLHKCNHFNTTSKWWNALFGFFTAALFSYTFVSLYLLYHRCHWVLALSLLLTLISLIGSLLFQRYIQRQSHVSIQQWYRYVIGTTDSSRYLGFAIREEHRHCASFRAWITQVLQTQQDFIESTRLLLRPSVC